MFRCCARDCSGDADAAFFAGCEYEVGRAEDGLPQGCSLEFRLGGGERNKYVNSELKSSDPYWIEFVKNALKTGDLPYEVDNHLNWMTHVQGRPEHCGKDEDSSRDDGKTHNNYASSRLYYGSFCDSNVCAAGAATCIYSYSKSVNILSRIINLTNVHTE